MKIFSIFWSKIFADIIWTCDQAANLCLFDRTFIPEHEICENTFCLDERPNLCLDHSIFRTGQYSEQYCKHGRRDPNQVRHHQQKIHFFKTNYK